MNDEIQKKLSQKPGENPVDEVIKKMLKKQADSCAWAKKKLEEQEEEEISKLVN